MISELSELKNEFETMRQKYREYLPKVDPALIDDLLKRQMENPGFSPIYMVEMFTETGLDPQKIREFVIAKTGQSPAIYDNSTHYAFQQRLTLEELEELSNVEGVLEVTGDYSGGLGTWAPSHEYTYSEDWKPLKKDSQRFVGTEPVRSAQQQRSGSRITAKMLSSNDMTIRSRREKN